jgi:hypothetical protein
MDTKIQHGTEVRKCQVAGSWKKIAHCRQGALKFMHVVCDIPHKTRISRKNYFTYFPYISNLFEVNEPNLMELNLRQVTLTSFKSI